MASPAPTHVCEKRVQVAVRDYPVDSDMDSLRDFDEY